MSKEHAKKFHQRLTHDQELREKVRNASEQILKVARDHDLHFTREELVEVMRDRWGEMTAKGTTPGENDADTFVSERPSY